MTFLSQLERVPPELLVFAFVAVLLMVAVLVLVFGWRNSSDKGAVATQAPRPQRPLPTNLAWRFLDFDEHRRPY